MNKKFLITAASISIFILILVLILSPKRNTAQTSPSTSDSTTPLGAQIATLIRDNSPTSSLDKELERKLPLYFEQFKTSVEIDTNISIYRLSTDKPRVVHLEIYGLSYLNKDSNEKTNPNVTAFKESYEKGIQMIESVNLDPQKFIFVFSDKPYIQQTSKDWVTTLKL